jgi:hypothetical protein
VKTRGGVGYHQSFLVGAKTAVVGTSPLGVVSGGTVEVVFETRIADQS